jgi:cobalt-zinc-cadmium efflux system membrane fusion protein
VRSVFISPHIPEERNPSEISTEPQCASMRFIAPWGGPHANAWRFRGGSVALLAGTALLFLSSCARGPASAQSNDTPPPTVQTAPDLNVVSVENPERFKLAAVTARSEADQLTANGIIAPDVSRNVPVNVLTSGRVVEVRARLGDDVQKGQVILTMTSSDISQAISDYKKFRADEELAQKQLDRAQILFSNGAMAQKDLEVAQGAFHKAQVDTQTAAEHIRILGGDIQNPSSLIEIRAPASGTIIEQNVTAAAGVKSLDNSPNLFTIADLSHVWVLCDVYENNLSQVHLQDSADIELNAFPNRRFKGRITNISAMLDPNTRAAKVRIELPNEKGTLRPNMFASVHFLSQGGQSRVVVPVSAVLRLHDRDWIFVKIGEKQFRRTEVQAGPVNADGTQQIISGVRAGDQVVVNALPFDREVQKD